MLTLTVLVKLWALEYLLVFPLAVTASGGLSVVAKWNVHQLEQTAILSVR